MLYPEIQKGKEAMKSSDFKQNIGRTDACMKRITKATKGYGKMSLNYTLFADSWFSRVKKAGEVMAEGVDYCDPTKTSHK